MSDLEGYRELSARLQAMGQTRDLMARIGLETVREAKLHVARKTGTTGRTIRLTRVTDETAAVTVGGAGLFLERGTKAHIIRPRKPGGVLRFPAHGVKTTLGGRVTTGAARALGNAAYVFASFVRHPGTRKQPFLVPAARKALDQFGISRIIENWNRAA